MANVAESDATLQSLLTVLEGKWAVDPRLGVSLQPGLTDEAIDAAMANIGLTLPDDVRAWFRWHDGVDPALNLDLCVGGSGMRFRRLETLLDDYQVALEDAREFAEAFGGSLAENGWDPEWFPVFRNLSGTLIGVDCSAAGFGRLHSSRFGDVVRDVAPSLTAVLEWWCELYDQGVFVFDGFWTIDDSHMLDNRFPRML